MINLKGNNIYLRALEPEDIDYLYSIENDEKFWDISNTIKPYSKHTLRKYLENSNLDIYTVKQLRLVICDYKHNQIGLIDLFDIDFNNHRAGLGIMINLNFRGKGYSKQAIKLIISYAKTKLNLNQIYCNILETNNISIDLFKSLGFSCVGLKKNWIYSNGEFKNEYLFQLI